MQSCGRDGGGAGGHIRALLASYCPLLFGRGGGGVAPLSPHVFPALIKACAATPRALLPLALRLHAHAVVLGRAASDPYVASSLIHFYSKCGVLCSARRLFDAMPPGKDVVPWSAVIAAHARAGDPAGAFALFNEMRRDGVRPNSITFLSLVSRDAFLPSDHLRCLHASAFTYGLESDLVLSNAMLSAYGKCGSVELAWRLFDSMPVKDVVSWNSIVSCYARIGRVQDAFSLLMSMRNEGILPDQQTFTSLISCIANDRSGQRLVRLGNLLHAMVLTSGFGLDGHVETALISMFLKFMNYDIAFRLFDGSSHHQDVVLWSAMISGLAQNDEAEKALLLFRQMLDWGLVPSTTTLASALSACAQLGSFNHGASIHGYIIRKKLWIDVAAQNSLVTVYAKCGRLRQAVQMFEMMEDRDLISWNAVVSGCAQNGHLDEAFLFFQRMRLALQRPDTITVVSLLQVCASTGALHHGKLVHDFVIRQELDPSMSLDTSLVDMYSKCGDLEAAFKCFHLMSEHDLVSWGALISGFGSHGRGEVALQLYDDFINRGMMPNDVILLSVLSACSHAGLVTEGLRVLKSMKEQFGVEPDIEHWGCITDLLCRAGRLEEALGFACTMSPKPNADILGMILDACRTGGYTSLAEEIAGKIVGLRPTSAGSYVQLAHGYASMNRWDEVGEAWMQMRALGLKKAPAWSFIELNGIITTFFAEHHSHPHYEDIVVLLNILDGEMRDKQNLHIHLVGDQQLD